MPTYFQFFLDGDSINWFSHLRADSIARDVPLTTEYLKTTFLHQYAKTLLSDEDEARRMLFRGDFSMQRSGNYQAYELAFRGVKRDLPNMHTADAIFWFLNGLSPILKNACAVQPISNKDWTDLDALMVFS